MGWYLVGIGILFLNLFVGYHFGSPLSKPQRKGVGIVSLFLILPTALYFLLFFLGKTDFTWMIVLSYVATFYIGILCYSAILFFLWDLYRLLFQKVEKKACPIQIKHTLLILVIALGITLVGVINAKEIVVKQYDLTLEKKQSSLDELNLVLLGDLHLGSNVRGKELQQIVQKIKDLNPDLVILDGDIFDEGTPERLKQQFFELFQTLKLRYGIFSIIGNHELHDRTLNTDLKKMEQVGIQVLADRRILVDEAFYLIGRKDIQQKRKSLTSLLQEKEDYPTILLEHRPHFLAAKASKKIDLQLSAHTHNGQIIPFQAFDWVTHRMTYGHYKRGSYQMIVTSGVGTWGIPLRVGSNCEITNLHIKFQ